MKFLLNQVNKTKITYMCFCVFLFFIFLLPPLHTRIRFLSDKRQAAGSTALKPPELFSPQNHLPVQRKRLVWIRESIYENMNKVLKEMIYFIYEVSYCDFICFAK